MSDNTEFGFAKLVPGFDFLQNLAKGTSHSMPQMPSLSSWIAPTLNIEELEKRIAELKAVHFWLDQNSKALSATIQALEVQKMTLATLQGMNFNISEMANALRLKPVEPKSRREQRAAEKEPEAASADEAAAGSAAGGKATAKKGNGAAGGPVDPLQWWGALTQQFQEIATNAMKDVAEKSANERARSMEAGKEAMKTASGMAAEAVSSIPKMMSAAPAKKAAKATGAKQAPARKAAPRKRAAKTA